MIFILISTQYLACLSTSSSEDKLAFDVGLEREANSKFVQSLPC